MNAPAKLLPWLVLLNAILMALIAERYTTLQQAWSEYQMASTSYVLLHEDRPR